MKPTVRIAAVLVIASVGWAALSVAQIRAAAAPPPAAAEPAKPKPPSLVAELTTVLIDRAGHTSQSTARLFRLGNKVRIESHRTNPIEVAVYDYDILKQFRIYEDDRMFFENQIPESVYARALREGLVSAADGLEIEYERIPLRSDMFDGHPTQIVLQLRWVKGKRDGGVDYTLLWEAEDLNRIPLRIAYHLPNYGLRIVEYHSVRIEPVDETLMKTPRGFVSMSPY